jgi:hypothetical protein
VGLAPAAPTAADRDVIHVPALSGRSERVTPRLCTALAATLRVFALPVSSVRDRDLGATCTPDYTDGGSYGLLHRHTYLSTVLPLA